MRRDYLLPSTKPVEVGALHAELVRAGVPVNGVYAVEGGWRVWREGAAFTDDEQARMRQAEAAHDAVAVVSARAIRERQRQDEQRKNPATLTLPERVRRLEIIGGLD